MIERRRPIDRCDADGCHNLAPRQTTRTGPRYCSQFCAGVAKRAPTYGWPRPPIRRDQRRAVLDRAGAVCAGCGENIDLTLSDTQDSRYLSIDHVVPISVGADVDDVLALHVAENMQPMHRGCNSAKGSRLPAWADLDDTQRLLITTLGLRTLWVSDERTRSALK